MLASTLGDPSDLDRRFTSYAESLLLCMEQCNDDVRHRPDAALWNARRSVESLVGAVLVRLKRHDAWREKNPTLHTLIGQVTDRFHEAEGFLPRLQDLGNDGAHLRVWMRTDPPWHEARLAATKLAAASAWFVATSREQGWGLTEALALEIAKVSASLETAQRSPTLEVVLAGDLERQLEQERAASRRASERNAMLGAELEAERAVAVRLRDENRILSEDLGRLRLRAPAATPRPAEAAATPVPPATLARRSGVSSRAAALFTLAGAGIGVGVGFLVASSAAPPRAAVPSTGERVPSLPSTSAVPSLPSTSAVPSLPSSETAPSASASPAPPTSCFTGMVLVPKGTLSLSQPHRSSWPAPRSLLVRTDVQAFCIHATPVTAGDFGDCVQRGKCRVPPRSCNLRAAPRLPMNCVEHHEAQQYCEAMGASLPSLAEWERALRSIAHIEIARDTGEWIADVFPSPLLERGALAPCDGGACSFMWFDARVAESKGSEPRLSWNQGSKGTEALGFRCVHR